MGWGNASRKSDRRRAVSARLRCGNPRPAEVRHRLSLVRTFLGLLAVALLVSACRAGPGADHYATVLDSLGVPETWELVHTTVLSQTGPDHRVDPSRSQDDIGCFEGNCPSVIRYYIVDGPGSDILATARGLLSDAGFSIGHSAEPACDIPPGGLACGVEATRGTDYVEVTIYRPGTTTADGFGGSDPSKAVVTVAARLNE